MNHPVRCHRCILIRRILKESVESTLNASQIAVEIYGVSRLSHTPSGSVRDVLTHLEGMSARGIVTRFRNRTWELKPGDSHE